MLNELIKSISPLNENAMKKAQEKWDNIAKPLRSLGVLEDMIIKLSGITGSSEITSLKKAVLIFCADNGVVAEGVTQTGSEVTAKVTENFTKGIASINSFARVCGADVFPIDIGISKDMICSGLDTRKIAYGTKNFAVEPAMTRKQVEDAILTGISLVKEKKEQGYNMIITGEMGIGNTTTSSAVFSVLNNCDPTTVTGRGAGLTSDGVKHKAEVIRKAIEKHKPNPNDIIDILSKLGGIDICGMTGAFLGGAIYSVPILIDGFISAVSANCAVKLAPLCKDYMYATHCSSEPAGRMALESLGFKACIECEMCLGEGTGGVIGAKLFDFALSAYNEISDFRNADVEKYELLK